MVVQAAGEVGMYGSSESGQPAVADPLSGLRKQLTDAYGDQLPTEAIDRIAEESLVEFMDAKVREFVPVLAWRRARQRLRHTT
ncbi:MAG: hypothetical protein ABWZ53_01205 [Actinomycetota bacterium]